MFSLGGTFENGIRPYLRTVLMFYDEVPEVKGATWK
jgi:hypothetical protein